MDGGFLEIRLVDNPSIVAQEVARCFDLCELFDLLRSRTTELDSVVEIPEPGYGALYLSAFNSRSITIPRMASLSTASMTIARSTVFLSLLGMPAG